MSLSAEQLERLKKQLRLEHSEDDDELRNYHRQARIYIKNQVGVIDETNEDMKEQYDQACALLVQHWYDNRESFRIGNNSYEIPHSFDSVVRQLKYCYPVGDSL